jgi:uncharacterized protein YdeI (YjbR/CyaY-like superfamily)
MMMFMPKAVSASASSVKTNAKTVAGNAVKEFHAEDRNAWRAWLKENHDTEKSVWLIIYKKAAATPSVYYDEAVDVALCFGWIDSVRIKRDGESFRQFFARRNPKSKWSAVNKAKVEKLIAAGLMTKSGLQMIELAKQSGTWNALDAVELLTIPSDLAEAFESNPTAKNYFEAFSRSSKRGILEWLLNAKRSDTRAKRIEQIVTLAAQNKRAQFDKA